jgi:hypothetical protein
MLRERQTLGFQVLRMCVVLSVIVICAVILHRASLRWLGRS